MKAVREFAILAPVPLEHLRSGQEIARKEGFVAFGTRKWDLFRKIEALRQGAPVVALIYPSHEDDPAKLSHVVSWFGRYVGYEETRNGAHSLGMRHRPPSTAKPVSDNRGHWAAFWHVELLRELPIDKHVPIGKIGKVKGGWRKDAPPRGPELVALPETLADEL